jgi:hypothetical protein
MATDYFVHRAKGFETPNGIRWPVRPKDTVGIPQNPRVAAALAKWKCTARVTHNAYDVVNEHGDAIELPFGASERDWEIAAETVGRYRE